MKLSYGAGNGLTINGEIGDYIEIKLPDGGVVYMKIKRDVVLDQYEVEVEQSTRVVIKKS